MSRRFENRLGVIKGELKGLKMILQSIQDWFIRNTPSGVNIMDNIFLPLRRIVILQKIEQAAGRELPNGMIQRLLKANGYRCSIAG